MSVQATTATCDPQARHEVWSAALGGDLADLRQLWDGSSDERAELLAACLERGDREGRAALLLLFSLAAWRLGEPAPARTQALEAWELVQGRVSPASEALVLTQVAAALEASGDARSARRAARRAEAALAASGGEGLPQMLAVRTQLLGIARRGGLAAADLELRLDRTLADLERNAEVPGGPAGVRRLEEVFVNQPNPPHWALVHHLRWANVFER